MVSTEYRTALRETWEQVLDEQREVDLPTVANRFITTNAGLVEREQSRSFYAMVLRDLKELARAETENASQLTLFGFPSVIAVPVPDDGYHYMQATKATFNELLAGGEVRDVNVRRAQEKRDAYYGAVERVRPIMEGTGKTLADALRELGESAA